MIPLRGATGVLIFPFDEPLCSCLTNYDKAAQWFAVLGCKKAGIKKSYLNNIGSKCLGCRMGWAGSNINWVQQAFYQHPEISGVQAHPPAMQLYKQEMNWCNF